MSEPTIDCPYCEHRVVVTKGLCPVCNSELKGAVAEQRKALKKKARTLAISTRAKGATSEEIEAELARNGFDNGMIKEIMLELEGKAPLASAEMNNSELRHGVYWLVGGILVTVVSYGIASSSKSGGVYFIAWGPMVVGGIKFIRALIRSNN